MSRPEYQMPPHLFYNTDEAVKYTNCSRIIEVQSKLSERAIQLLNLQDAALVLDIGCGSGISGHYLTEEGLQWVGLDISESMLNTAISKKSQGELILSDMGQGFKFRPGVFDGAISISALQWLCVSYANCEIPFKRLFCFFQSLRNCLRMDSRAVFQFYPDGNDQISLITNAALKAGFHGSMVVDYPHSSKAKKIYLVLELGGQSDKKTFEMIEGLKDLNEDDEEEKKVDFIDQMQRSKKIKKQKDNKKLRYKSKQWIIQKKERYARKFVNLNGTKAKESSKYTGRKRNNFK